MPTVAVPITEQQISDLVDTFYAKVRLDPIIGPVFNEAVKSWPAHLALLKEFWSTALLSSATYKGNPMLTHLKLDIGPVHFIRWLQLFAETTHEVMSPEQAAIVIAKSRRIAENFSAAIALYGPAARNAAS